jgi:hypothetical protein
LAHLGGRPLSDAESLFCLGFHRATGPARFFVTVRRDVPVVLGLWLITVVGQASVGPAADVKVVGGRVHIHATATSVSEVLDRLARTTGMKVVYDGAPPTDRLTAAIDAASETEALSRLLEGLGLTYAFKLDSGGRHVETLFVTSSTSRRASSGASTSTTPTRTAQLNSEDYENNALLEEPDPVNDPAAMTQASPEGVPLENAGNPGYAGGAAAGQVGGVPTTADEPTPAFPGAASLPTPSNPFPANPGFPAFPGPVSYP